MAGEVVYAALNISSEPHSSNLLYPSQQLGASQRSCWHQVIIWVGVIWNIVLVATVIVLALQLEKAKLETDVSRSTGSPPVKCKSSSADFQHLLKKLCNQSQSRSSVNSACRLCPVHWYLHKEMCYWPSEGHKSWNESKNDCLADDSQLLVIQDREEMEFIKQITRGTDTYWIGLFLSSSENKWMWVTGSQFDKNMFDRPKDTQRNFCGTIKDKINSDKCSAVRKWICQKEAVLLTVRI